MASQKNTRTNRQTDGQTDRQQAEKHEEKHTDKAENSRWAYWAQTNINSETSRQATTHLYKPTNRQTKRVSRNTDMEGI